MKKIFPFILIAFISCKKTMEENCFVNTKKEMFGPYIEEKPYSVKQILAAKPNYLEIQNLTQFRSFKKDSIENHTYNFDEKNIKKASEDYQKKYKEFNDKFLGQFQYQFFQDTGKEKFALGRNNLGFWLLKISENKAKAYFLGLSFSHYYINNVQEKPIINDGYLQFEGSLVKIIKVPGLPGYEDYSAMEDGKLFRIKLGDLEKDSDKDGYNDIFENCFGLNPNNKDTDADGKDDGEDMNPLYESEKNKFSELYDELLMDFYGPNQNNLKKRQYYFTVFENDCNYFQKVNPNFRVLILPENAHKKTDYDKVTQLAHHGFSKMKKDKDNANKLYMTEWSNSSDEYFSAEYKNGKWIFTAISSTVV